MRIVIAGVSGSGKSTVGKLLAERLGCEFADADDFHPPENIAKMKAGIPLVDADRAGWLDTLGRHLADRAAIILACSALKKTYRDRLRELAGPLEFFVLQVERQVLTERMESREHFMPPSLLDSQLATLELGDDVHVIGNRSSAEEVAALIATALALSGIARPPFPPEAPAVRSILITGGNGGLGLGIARYFLEKEPDARIWLGVRSNRPGAEALAAESAGRVALVNLEATSKESWEAAVATILEADGRLDVLVNNAGLHCDHLLAAMPDEAWSSVISANLDSVFLGCRAVIRPMMARRFGRIVNIASLSAILPPLGQTNYAAAKAGVVALTRTLAKEVARAGITVNAVLPGYIDTGALSQMDEEAAKRARAGIPMRRFGNPAEVAAGVWFLACQDAAYVTGSALKIDGGIF